MAKYKLTDLATVIRSKNAGPYELTFDIIFKDRETYQKVKAAQVINQQTFADLYRVSLDKIIAFIEFEPANAIKATIERPRASGELGETDVYGAQQHAPLLNLEVEL